MSTVVRYVSLTYMTVIFSDTIVGTFIVDLSPLYLTVTDKGVLIAGSTKFRPLASSADKTTLFRAP